MRTMPRLRGWRARPAHPVVPFVGVLGLVVLVAACGGPGSSQESGPDRGGPSVSPAPPPLPPTPVSSSAVPTPTPAVIDPVPGRRERRVAWRFVSAVPGPAVLVEVQVGGAPCDAVTAVEVRESATAVGLTVWAGRTPGAHCHGIPATVGTFRLRVPLEHPLGDRSITRL
jgi:hypothetical protein